MTAETAGRRKKVAAALAAVTLYMEQEGAVAREQEEALQEPVSAGLSYWANSGRQEVMAMRRLTQLRAIRF